MNPNIVLKQDLPSNVSVQNVPPNGFNTGFVFMLILSCSLCRAPSRPPWCKQRLRDLQLSECLGINHKRQNMIDIF